MTTIARHLGKKLTVADKVALVKKAKRIPFTMSEEEVDKLMDLADAAEERGDAKEAERLKKQIPISWDLAAVVIEQFGSRRLLEMGFDLSYAVAVLGESFVYDE